MHAKQERAHTQSHDCQCVCTDEVVIHLANLCCCEVSVDSTQRFHSSADFCTHVQASFQPLPVCLELLPVSTKMKLNEQAKRAESRAMDVRRAWSLRMDDETVCKRLYGMVEVVLALIWLKLGPVSYTHLTLPTILLV